MLGVDHTVVGGQPRHRDVLFVDGGAGVVVEARHEAVDAGGRDRVELAGGRIPAVDGDVADAAAVGEGGHDEQVAVRVVAGERDRPAGRALAADCRILEEPQGDVVVAVVLRLLQAVVEVLVPALLLNGGEAVHDVDLAVDVVVPVALPARKVKGVLRAGGEGRRIERLEGRRHDVVVEVLLEIGGHEGVPGEAGERLRSGHRSGRVTGRGRRRIVDVEQGVPVVRTGESVCDGPGEYDGAADRCASVGQVARARVSFELEALVVDGDCGADGKHADDGRARYREEPSAPDSALCDIHDLPSVVALKPVIADSLPACRPSCAPPVVPPGGRTPAPSR